MEPMSLFLITQTAFKINSTKLFSILPNISPYDVIHLEVRALLVELPLDHAGGDPLDDEVFQFPDGGDGELGHEEAVGQHLVLLGEADHSEQPQLAAHGLGHLGQRVGALGQALVAPVREYVEQGEVLAVRPVSQLLNILFEGLRCQCSKENALALGYLNVGHVQQLSEHEDRGSLQRLLDQLHRGRPLGVLGQQHELLQGVGSHSVQVNHRAFV